MVALGLLGAIYILRDWIHGLGLHRLDCLDLHRPGPSTTLASFPESLEFVYTCLCVYINSVAQVYILIFLPTLVSIHNVNFEIRCHSTHLHLLCVSKRDGSSK